MAWCNVTDMNDHLPLDVYDANGLRIDRRISRFDTVTGEIESFVYTKDGQLVEEPEGELKKRIEKFAAPLLWKSISAGEISSRTYWEENG